MGPRSKAPGHNKKRLGNAPRTLKKLEVRAKRKRNGLKQKHEAAVKAVAGPSRTGKAKTKKARQLKKKLCELAAKGDISEKDFEMEEAVVVEGVTKPKRSGRNADKKGSAATEPEAMHE
mmetsp:Transcript_29508/g.83231  ORF Transcript_29508/g.83231 Transcript_29508/m.83231 type:complete len:119 (-) Transcript_29508:373-729(-)